MIPNNQTMIYHFLEESARFFPDKVALIHENVRATYVQVNAGANQLAHWLISQGITRGDRVVVILENCLEYVISYYGILKAGAVAVPLSIDIKPRRLRHLLEELKPKAVISSSMFEKLLQVTDLTSLKPQAIILRSPKLNWSAAPFPVFEWEELIGDRESSNPSIQLSESALASIIYTSGSTGIPKGVMLSHSNIVSNTHSICQCLHLSEKDIQMVVLPFSYVMGKSLLNTHFAVGGTVVINNKFAYPACIIKQMVEERVTGFSGVPSTYVYLIHRSPLASYRHKLDSLRYCSQAGGHLSRQIKKKLRQVLPQHTKVYIMYGASEASARLTCLEPHRLQDKIDSIGKPIPGVTLRVLDGQGEEVPIGQVGELVADGPNIMQGYWNDGQLTAKVLDKNGYHTGDLGYQDAEGYFYVVGRQDGLVKVGGHRIHPQEIEDVLIDTGLVMEAIVLSIQDTLLGNRLIAVVSPKAEDCSEKLIMSRCAERLPRYKLPSTVKLVQTLPKKSNGKVDRTECLELVRS